MFSLNGKTCVVTGASRGLGRAIALTFADQGANVVLAARSRGELDTAASEIAAKGRRALVQPTDITAPAELTALADAAIAAFGRIDVWVNNAGGFANEKGAMAEWLDVTEAGWDAMLALNLKAQIFGAQAAARAMKKTGGGAIIFLSSIDSLYAAPGGEGIYGACKAALNNVTQTMAVELGQYGIRVNAIAPAVVETPLTQPWLATEEDRRARAAFYPLRRVGQPSDVAGAAVYLASDEAGWVSGAVLLVSGGAVMTSDPYRYVMRVNQAKL
jgi:NAD(P)-dependent dehydrogenase (short-subunit alcohol dehydrogenase family)